MGIAFGKKEQEKSNLVSPQRMFDEGKRIMLGGRNPESRDDWSKMVNFWAANIHTGLEKSACRLLAKIFNAPLSEEDVTKIAEFQMSRKR
jgi:hypothetical protein